MKRQQQIPEYRPKAGEEFASAVRNTIALAKRAPGRRAKVVFNDTEVIAGANSSPRRLAEIYIAQRDQKNRRRGPVGRRTH